MEFVLRRLCEEFGEANARRLKLADLQRGYLAATAKAKGGEFDSTAAVMKVATVGETLSPAASVSTLCQIPINVLYGPTSDEAQYKTCTIYFYADGLQWTFTGCQGTWSLELTSGGMGVDSVFQEMLKE